MFIGSMAFSREMHAVQKRRNSRRQEARDETRRAAKETAQESTCLALSPISLRGIGESSVCFWNSRTIQTSFLLSARRELGDLSETPLATDEMRLAGAFRRELSALLYHSSLRRSLFNRLYDKLLDDCAPRAPSLENFH